MFFVFFYDRQETLTMVLARPRDAQASKRLRLTVPLLRQPEREFETEARAEKAGDRLPNKL